jgi:hypothetical protein
MTRRSQLALALFAGLLLALGVGVLSAQGTSKALAPCDAGGPGTIYDDHEVRVFEKEQEADVRSVICSHINGHRYRVAHYSLDGLSRSIDIVSAPGRWVGYSVLKVEADAALSGKACVLRLKDGERHCTSGLQVLSLDATRKGSVAWLAYDRRDPVNGLICCAVYEREQDADKAVKLDSGPDIEKSSFAVGGTRIYWTKAGQPKSATMP